MKHFSPKAVLFDLDGTVTDTEKIYQKYWVKTIRDSGYPDFPDDGALDLRSINSKDGNILMKNRLGEGFDYDLIHDRMKDYVEADLKEHGIPLKKGLFDAVSFLSENNIKAVIVTATTKKGAVAHLEAAGIEQYFDDVISAHDVARGKPHPDPYLFALKSLDISADEAIAVEDSPNGATSSVDAGIRTVFIPDLTPAPDELKPRLFAVLDSLFELPSVIA